ncbi:MAG: benzoate-CoA ligase family protein [Myxococcota bacterium]
MRFQVPGQRLNLTDHFLDARLREGRGNKRALVVDRPQGVSSHTYAEVAGWANRYGAMLQAKGLGMEDRVLILLPDGLEWVASFFGALKVGCTVLFVNPACSREELIFYLADSRARGLFCDQSGAAKLQDDHGLDFLGVVDAPEFLTRCEGPPPNLEAAPTLEEDFAIWLYSSGSTGAPKAAVHRAGDFVFNTERYPKEVLGMHEDDVTVSVPKLFFGYATGSNLLFPFAFGATAVLFPDRPTPERVFEVVETHGATILVNVPTLVAQMQQSWEKRIKKPDLSRLRLLTSAGEALPAELYERWMRGPGIDILDGIGSAEMFHVFISTRPGEKVPGSLGTLVEGYQARIVDGEEQDCEPGQVGTLWVGGDSALAFYWQRAAKTREVVRGRWVVTGDQFIQDERGHFFYQGRADDMMKVGGRWVSPQEIEGALLKHRAVAEAGVAPFERDGLVKPMAFVILKAGAEVDGPTLSSHVAEVLAPYKAPRQVIFVDTLPRGDRDKLDRKQLAAMAEAQG